MCADALPRGWAALLCVAWLATGCAALTPRLDSSPPALSTRALKGMAGGVLAGEGSSTPASSGPSPQARLHRRRGPREVGSAVPSASPAEAPPPGEDSAEPLSCGGHPVPPGWPDFSSGDARHLLAPFLACASPAEFVALQRGADMPRLVEALDDWRAVQLGALGPLRTEAAAVLTRKRAAFLLEAAEKYGLARAEVFALFVLHAAFDDELRELLRLLSRDKQLGETLGKMGSVREALGQRGLKLSDFPDRAEKPGDALRGLGRAARDALSSSPLSDGARYLELSARREQLPPPYQQALDEVERAQGEALFSPGSVALGGFDALTFGVPLGFYHLVAGTGHGVHSLAQGRYEQATRELAPAALLVALYAGGKGLRHLSDSTGAERAAVRRLPLPQVHLEELKEVAQRLGERLGRDGMGQVARYIQSSREAALLVCEGGEAAAVTLYEAQGNVARAQAWLSEAKRQRAGSTGTRVGAMKSPGALASLVDEAAGLPREVVEAKLAGVELESTGPRLSGNVAVLEKQRPSVDTAPPGAQGHPLWGEYVAYFEGRLAELREGKAAKPPLAWEGYGQMRGQFARGLGFERAMGALLRADAALPKARRRFLQDFEQPRIETNVGVAKSGASGVRYVDVLVIEEGPLSGPPRVETFSFKSRDFRFLDAEYLTAQMIADARDALRYYGEKLNIRRPTLRLRDSQMQVHRVRLIYEGGALKPKRHEILDDALRDAQDEVREVEVSVE